MIVLADHSNNNHLSIYLKNNGLLHDRNTKMSETKKDQQVSPNSRLLDRFVVLFT